MSPPSSACRSSSAQERRTRPAGLIVRCSATATCSPAAFATSRPACGTTSSKTSDPGPADPDARTFLREADPVLARIVDARPDFRPRAWTQDLRALDAFPALIFQLIGQQLSVRATRTILGRLEQIFGGRLPTPAQMLAADPDAVRSSGMSGRKVATVRAVAQRFVDGSLSDEALSGMSDEEVVAALTTIPRIRCEPRLARLRGSSPRAGPGYRRQSRPTAAIAISTVSPTSTAADFIICLLTVRASLPAPAGMTLDANG